MIISSVRPADVGLLVAIVVLLVLSGALALAETALVRMSRVKAKALADDGRRGARQLVSLVEHPEKFLNPLLLLVLICQLTSATLIGVVASHLFGGWGVIAATVFEVVVIFVLFEAAPKNWAVHNPERAALVSAPFVTATIAFPPVKWVSSLLIGLANRLIGRGAGEHAAPSSFVTESELLAMADVAHAEEVIEGEERNFIHSIIEFGDTVVREVMVPRPDMVTVDAEVTVSSALAEALSAGYSRLPVCLDSVDDIAGIAYTKDLIRAEHDGKGAAPVGEHVRLARYEPETKRLSVLLRQMQAEKFHLAIVVDEYGGTAGLVTLEDIIEELVGDIVDEFDVEQPDVVQHGDGVVVVSGRMNLDDLDDLLVASFPQGSWDTIGGLFLDAAGGVPRPGESVVVDGFKLTAVKLAGRRIDQVRIERTADETKHG